MTSRPRFEDRTPAGIWQSCERIASKLKSAPNRRGAVYLSHTSLFVIDPDATEQAERMGSRWTLIGTYDAKCDADLIYGDVMATLGQG